jgi:multiple sugar transport system permease protein
VRARRGRGWAAEQRRSFRTGLLPALYLVITSLTPLMPVNPDPAFDFSDPAGNYEAILVTGEFCRSVWVQIELSVVTVGTQLAAGLGLALLLDRPS